MMKTLTGVLTLAVAAGVFFVYTRPAYQSIQAIQSDIAQYDRALEKAKELAELKQTLLSRYNTFSASSLERLNRLLPDHVDNVRLVLDLDGIASRYGMAIQNVIISRVDEKAQQQATVIGALSAQVSTYDSLTLQFSTEGTYEDFTRFLQDLEGSVRIVDLVALKIEADKQAKRDEKGELIIVPNERYKYDVTVRTYWLK